MEESVIWDAGSADVHEVTEAAVAEHAASAIKVKILINAQRAQIVF